MPLNMGKFCPVCLAKGKMSKIKCFQINLTEATVMCENVECPFPFMKGVNTIIFERDFKSMNDPVATLKALSEHQKNLQKSRITEKCGGDAIDGSTAGPSSQMVNSCKTSVNSSVSQKIAEIESRLIINLGEINVDIFKKEEIMNNFDQRDSDICKVDGSSNESQVMTGTEDLGVDEVNVPQHVNIDRVSSADVISEFNTEMTVEVIHDGKLDEKFENDCTVRASNGAGMYECADKFPQLINNVNCTSEPKSTDVLNHLSSEMSATEKLKSEIQQPEIPSNDANTKMTNEAVVQNVYSAYANQVVNSFKNSEGSNVVSSTDTANMSNILSSVSKRKSLEVENDANSFAVVIKNVPLVSTNSNFTSVKDGFLSEHGKCSDKIGKNINSSDLINEMECPKVSDSACTPLVNKIKDFQTMNDTSRVAIKIDSEEHLATTRNQEEKKGDSDDIFIDNKSPKTPQEGVEENSIPINANQTIADSDSTQGLNDPLPKQFSISENKLEVSGNDGCSSGEIIVNTKLQDVICGNTGTEDIKSLISNAIQYTHPDQVAKSGRNSEFTKRIDSLQHTIADSDSTKGKNDPLPEQFSISENKLEVAGDDGSGSGEIIDETKLQGRICDDATVHENGGGMYSGIGSANYSMELTTEKCTKHIIADSDSSQAVNDPLPKQFSLSENKLEVGGNDGSSSGEIIDDTKLQDVICGNTGAEDIKSLISNAIQYTHPDQVAKSGRNSEFTKRIDSLHHTIADSDSTKGKNDPLPEQFSISENKLEVAGDDGSGSGEIIDETKLQGRICDDATVHENGGGMYSGIGSANYSMELATEKCTKHIIADSDSTQAVNDPKQFSISENKLEVGGNNGSSSGEIIDEPSIVKNTVTDDKSATEQNYYFSSKSTETGENSKLVSAVRIVDSKNSTKIMCKDCCAEMTKTSVSENDNNLCSNCVVSKNNFKNTSSVDSLEEMQSGSISAVASEAVSFNAINDASCPEIVIGSKPKILAIMNNSIIEDERANNFKIPDNYDTTMTCEKDNTSTVVNNILVDNESGNVNNPGVVINIRPRATNCSFKYIKCVGNGSNCFESITGTKNFKNTKKTVQDNLDITGVTRVTKHVKEFIIPVVLKDEKVDASVNMNSNLEDGLVTENVENFSEDFEGGKEDLETHINMVTSSAIMKDARSQFHSFLSAEKDNDGVIVVKDELLPASNPACNNDGVAPLTHSFASKISNAMERCSIEDIGNVNISNDAQFTSPKTDSPSVAMVGNIMNKSCIEEFSEIKFRVQRENLNDLNASDISTSELAENDKTLVTSLLPVVEDNINSSNDPVLNGIGKLEPTASTNLAENQSYRGSDYLESFVKENPECSKYLYLNTNSASATIFSKLEKINGNPCSLGNVSNQSTCTSTYNPNKFSEFKFSETQGTRRNRKVPVKARGSKRKRNIR